MALNYCSNCTTAYALGLDICPHCGKPSNTTVTETEPAEPRRTSKRRPPPASEVESPPEEPTSDG